MATKYWLGSASAVAQVSTIQITAYSASTTYKVTIGGVSVSVVGSGGTVNTVATALQSALAASTHPYFTAITWTKATDTVTATATIAGVPFVATSSATGGAGSIGAVTAVTASSGPNDWSTAANWSTGVVPASTDTVIFSNSSVNVCWGLSTSITAVTEIRVDQSYTGRIGLDYKTFAITSDGSTTDATAAEYRQLYCAIGTSSLKLGLPAISGSAAGSGRLMFDLGATTACAVEVYGTAAQSYDTNRSCIRLLGNNNNHAIRVRSSSGGIGLASEVPNETSLFYSVVVSDQSSTSKVITGYGSNIAFWEQYGGTSIVQSTNDIPNITVIGGTLTTEGAGKVTGTLSMYGGTLNHNMSGDVTSIRLHGGFLNGLNTAAVRAWNDIVIYPDAKIAYDPAIISVTGIKAGQAMTISS